MEGGKLLLGYNVWEENQKDITKNAGHSLVLCDGYVVNTWGFQQVNS